MSTWEWTEDGVPAPNAKRARNAEAIIARRRKVRWSARLGLTASMVVLAVLAVEIGMKAASVLNHADAGAAITTLSRVI